MVKFLKPGKVCIVLQGRFAGRKAVIVRNNDEGTKTHPFGHAIIAGVAEHPKQAKRKYSQMKNARRSKFPVFVKIANYSHLMPTRYGVDADLKSHINDKVVKDPTKRKQARSKVRKLFHQRYLAGKHRWFFTKLKF
eukprot:gb/GECH01011106.1/.p1 GENE.gb/GECH01011106.1/~~gb/GECH01011106.1/.p1  ORF type:complete len:136 (+),score=5.27 gb/GECH01011106.1/:1-408(+)